MATAVCERQTEQRQRTYRMMCGTNFAARFLARDRTGSIGFCLLDCFPRITPSPVSWNYDLKKTHTHTNWRNRKKRKKKTKKRRNPNGVKWTTIAAARTSVVIPRVVVWMVRGDIYFKPWWVFVSLSLESYNGRTSAYIRADMVEHSSSPKRWVFVSHRPSVIFIPLIHTNSIFSLCNIDIESRS